jgi:glycosyltransferase involved in cell wall biosynthesis
VPSVSDRLQSRRGENALVSVVVPCRDAERWITESLRSSLDQSGVTVEVLVVDDGSTDGSASVVERLADSRVTLLRQPAHGVSRARNVGTRLTRGEYIQYLDADDVLSPGALVSRVAALRRTGADVAYSDWVRYEATAAGDFQEGAPAAKTLGPRPEIDLFRGAWWPPGALLYRRPIVDAIGAWREDLPVIQDARFHLDAALRGARFVHVPQVGLRYRVHGPGSVSRRDPRAFLADCLRNALDVEGIWASDGGLDSERRAALRDIYAYICRAVSGVDGQLYDEAVTALLRVDPGYRPGSRLLRVATDVVGFRKAERVAAVWRRLARPRGGR